MPTSMSNMYTNVRLNLLINSKTYLKWTRNHCKALLSASEDKKYSTKSKKGDETQQGDENAFVPFKDIIKERRAEASRSILVQVQSSQSYKELHAFCSSNGNVKQMFHYSSGVEPMHFMVVEFNDENDALNVLKNSSYIGENQIVPVQSHFLWFRAASRRQPKLKTTKTPKLTMENGTTLTTDEKLYEELKHCKSISDQMNLLCEMTKLNDLGIRLRFLVAQQIEKSICGMFPNAVAYPFGSSVNGCGKMGCDLDLVLRLNEGEHYEDSRLVFHSKAGYGSERSVSQRHMETMSDIIQLFLPGCAQVRRILQARVPIIKFYQQFADVECDLSMSNMSGVHMSDFLYMMTSYDDRVKPLIFTIRRWASEVGLTNSSPGRWISNFSLTLLVLAFLQQSNHTQPVLPSLNELIKQAKPEDNIVTTEGVNCTFLRDLNHLKHPKTCKDSLQVLLLRFFEYYSQFDFDSKAISLLDGGPINKPEHSPLYIVNPLERGLNVSKNVSSEELTRFRNEIREAAWTLESQEHVSVASQWGISSLFLSRKSQRNFYNSFMPIRQGKLLQISKIFEVEENQIDYKNDSVKKQVADIKTEVSANIKELDNDNSQKGHAIVNKRKSRR